jgi:hypothetical protein
MILYFSQSRMKVIAEFQSLSFYARLTSLRILTSNGETSRVALPCLTVIGSLRTWATFTGPGSAIFGRPLGFPDCPFLNWDFSGGF